MVSEGGVKGFVKDAALAAAASFALDFAVELTGIDYLNRPSPIPITDREQTVVEAILGGTGVVLTALGALGVFAGKPIIGGYSKEALAYGIGILSGTSFYEHQGTRILGIRNLRHPIYR